MQIKSTLHTLRRKLRLGVKNRTRIASKSCTYLKNQKLLMIENRRMQHRLSGRGTAHASSKAGCSLRSIQESSSQASADRHGCPTGTDRRFDIVSSPSMNREHASGQALRNPMFNVQPLNSSLDWSHRTPGLPCTFREWPEVRIWMANTQGVLSIS